MKYKLKVWNGFDAFDPIIVNATSNADAISQGQELGDLYSITPQYGEEIKLPRPKESGGSAGETEIVCVPAWEGPGCISVMAWSAVLLLLIVSAYLLAINLPWCAVHGIGC